MAKLHCPIHNELDKRSPKPTYVAGLRFGCCSMPVPNHAADMRMPDTGERVDGAYYIVRNICGLPLFTSDTDSSSEGWDIAAMQTYKETAMGVAAKKK